MNPLEQAQVDFTAKLKSEAYFADIAVGAPRVFKEGDKIRTPKTINDRLDQALTGLVVTGGKIGAAVRVLQPSFTVPKPDLPGPHGRLVLPVRCQVHPIYNFSESGTGKYVTDIALEVVRLGHLFGIEGAALRFICDQDTFVPDFNPESQLMTLDVLLHSECVNPSLEKCAKPTISEAALTITLTNATSGAAIYYTTDGSFPGSGNSAALVYSAPFVVISGATVRWAAYKTGLAGSDISQAVIT